MPQTGLGGRRDPPIGELRKEFEKKTEDILPDKAKTNWPIHLDHCFKRVVLDNTVNTKWDTEIGRPAIRNMSYSQLKKANKIADTLIQDGRPMVERLNKKSLEYRGEARCE